MWVKANNTAGKIYTKLTTAMSHDGGLVVKQG